MTNPAKEALSIAKNIQEDVKGIMATEQLPPCPHCRLDAWLFINMRVFGYRRAYFDNETGDFIESDIDNVGDSPSSVARCQECGKIRRDVKVISDYKIARRSNFKIARRKVKEEE